MSTIKPFKTRYLHVKDGNEIYWKTSGNPNGKPALYLHGGPGSGIMPGYRNHFDPDKFLIVSLDQRGCGRSKPYPLILESEKHLRNENINFVKNRDAYNSDANYPSSLVGIYNSMEYRGQRLSSFWVSPLQFNPIKKQLVIYKKLKVRITFKGNRLSSIWHRKRP